MTATETLSSALADRYAIERLIGEGGMATVYLARDIRHNRRVALKVLRPDLGAVVGVERFLAEIQVTANLQHPNLLPLFDSGAAGDLLFYVMPYVQGESLRARLDREKQLPVEEAIRLATAIAGALDYAHRQGVIHRDLKPENVLLQEGQPLVADFGIALAVSNAGGTRITQTGLSLGTPHYMSPEQATGDRVIDGRTDIYSLGALTYEMLTGEPPHTGSTSQAVIARVLTERPRSIRASRSSVPDHVEGAVERALEKLPADRWPTAREFSEALAGARPVTRSATAATTAVPMPFGSGARVRPAGREMVAWALAAAAIAVGWWAMRSPEIVQPMTRSTIELPDSTIVNGSFYAGLPSVALSRDGSFMAFVGTGRALQRQSLYVRQLSDLEARPLEGVDYASGPAFSLDNSWLAFVDRNRSLRRIPVAGGTSQVLADSVSWASWGDDGAIYFIRPSSGIWTVGVDGAAPRLIAAIDSAAGLLGLNHLDVLPGSKLALVRVRRADGGLYSTTVDLRSGRLSEVRLPGPTAKYVAPGFLVYQSDDGGGLSVVRFSADKGEVTGSPIRIAESLAGLASAGLDYSVAANGTIVARARTSVTLGSTRLVQFDQRGISRILRQDEQRYDQPRISPDGRQLVVRVGAGAFNTGDLWVLELASGALTRLTSGNNSFRPTWSRDGKRIFYLTGLPGTSKVISKAWDASGPDSVVLDRSEIAEFVEGSPDGWSAVRNYGARDIFLLPTDSIATAQLRPFVFGPSNETDMTISPSGRLMAYQSDETGRVEVYVRPVPGPGPRVPVSVNGGQRPVWSPDGGTLYFNTETTIMAAAITEQPTVAVTRRDSLFHASVATDGLNMTVLPGGRGFIAAVDPQRQVAVPFRLMLITNWQALFAPSRESR
jgi:hypothetical protein